MISIQVPASRGRRPQSPQSCIRELHNLRDCAAWIYSDVDPPTHPSTFASIPAPNPLVLSIPTLRQRFSTNCLSARREDLVFNECQVCHAKIQGLFKDLFDSCNFQGLFKTLKTVFEIQVLFKVFKLTHPAESRQASFTQSGVWTPSDAYVILLAVHKPCAWTEKFWISPTIIQWGR